MEPEGYYRVHKSLPLVLTQMNPVHTFTLFDKNPF